MQAQPVPFLRQVADYYLGSGFRNRIFVFPNRRSMAFFKKYIADALKESGGNPVIAPRMMGVNEFFSAMTGRNVTDRLTLLLKLYDCYCRLVPGHETLDEFIYWADALISDFDDIDKYRIDASQLFTNILDLKSLDDDMSYLTKEQADAISRLAAHFSSEKWDRTVDRKIDVKERFLKVWTVMLKLYQDYRSSLDEQGMAYEGMIYRSLASSIEEEGAAHMLSAMAPEATGCVFIGLNTLNSCEKAVLRALKNEGLAEFCWDFDGPFFRDRDSSRLHRNQATRFILENIREFGNVLGDASAVDMHPEVHVISVPSATGQAKALHEIVTRTPEEERGLDFAVVLPDESMLMPVLSSLPAVGNVNVTMGYPLSSSEWNSMMHSIIALQMHVRDGKYFYHRQVSDVLSSGIVKGVGGEACAACTKEVQKAAKAFVPVTDLQGCDLFKVIFRPAISQMTSPDAGQIHRLIDYLCEVVETVAKGLDKDMDSLHLECAYRYLQCMRRLAAQDLDILPKTFVHLVEQLVSGVSVPFAGEPLGGLQVMGPLETRGLDFKHLVILNANEGVFPGRNSRASYIPPELRTAFGLPTYELQDSVWAYYFYRMISRAEKVWMVYDSRTEGLATGEESRYVKQLAYIYPDLCDIVRESATGRLESSVEEDSIEKTDEDVEAIKNMVLSASAIHRYLTCQAQFYYYDVKKLYPEDEVAEDLDGGMLGTVCHDTLQAIYCCEQTMAPDYFFDKRVKDEYSGRNVGVVTEEFLEGWLSRKDDIRRKVMAQICHLLHCPAVEGRDLVSVEIAIKYITGVLEADLELVRTHGRLRILHLEEEYSGIVKEHKFKGFVDRVDTFDDGTVRIVDYKTGSDKQAVLDSSASAAAIAKDVFDNKQGYKAAFQFFLYDVLARQKDKTVQGLTMLNSMYSMTDLFTSGVEAYPVSDEVVAAMESGLASLLENMEKKENAFVRTPGYMNSNCRFCKYGVLCGKLAKKK